MSTALFGLLLASGLVGQKSEDKLMIIDQATEAAKQGKPLAVVALLSPMVAKLDAYEVDIIDKALTRRKGPTLGQLLGEAHVVLLERNLHGALPRKTSRGSLRETLLVLPYFGERMRESLEAEAQGEAMNAEFPETADFERYDDLSHELLVLERQMASTSLVGQYAAKLAKKISRKKLAKMSAPDRAVMDANYADLSDEVERASRNVAERGIELSLARLEVALAVLADRKMTADRVIAANLLIEDAERVLGFLAANKRTAAKKEFLRGPLNEPGLRTDVQRKASAGKKLAGDLAKTAPLFFRGLDWWFRGRYGEGPELWGLARSEQSLSSPKTRWAVLLPAEKPEPTDPFTAVKPKESMPRYERRHVIAWPLDEAYSDDILEKAGRGIGSPLTSIQPSRPLIGFGNLIGSGDPFNRSSGASRQRQFYYYYQPMVDPRTVPRVRKVRVKRRSTIDPNPAMLERLVGFDEYREALRLFETLLGSTSTEQLRAMDAVIADREEYTVFTNLATLSPLAPTSSLLARPKRDEDNRRLGLAWIMALARVEASALAAAFTGDVEEFSKLPPTKFESDAYRQVLMDGLLTHYLMLEADRDVPRFGVTERTSPEMLAYNQRAVMITAFHNAAMRTVAPVLNANQNRELRKRQDKVDGLRREIQQIMFQRGP